MVVLLVEILRIHAGRQYRIDAQKAEAARKAASYQVLIGGKLNVS